MSAPQHPCFLEARANTPEGGVEVRRREHDGWALVLTTPFFDDDKAKLALSTDIRFCPWCGWRLPRAEAET